jgi:Mn2+/Fe2+ NRAMP family transporter
MNWLMFFHFVGIVIGLGAVIVIETMGFFSRKDKYKTQTTIRAHHTTKPLIWIGTFIILITWIFMLVGSSFKGIYFWKSLILFVMILNGCFLSFVVSPALTKLESKNVLLPKKLQNKIKLSFFISFTSWWSFVILSFWNL